MGMDIQLTDEQSAALQAIRSFVLDDKQDAFILRGSAGTGKTMLIAKLVDTLDSLHLTYELLAPTGRAARILGNKIKQISSTAQSDGVTIHRAIYALEYMEVNEEAEAANDPGLRMFFPLKKEEPTVSLFIIDESSMVGDKKTLGDVMQFGSGRLLKDIISYARMCRPGRANDHITKLLFVGDPAQLPPVGENSSPALNDDYLRSEYKIQVGSFDLKNVMRQAQGSAILDRATELRDALFASRFNSFSLQPNQQDIEHVQSQKVIDLVVDGLQRKESNVVVVYSNATALEYNCNIRERRWGNSGLPIRVGDLLLVNKNSTTHMLSNGDLVKATEADAGSKHVTVHLKGGHHVELWFRDVTVAFRDGAGSVVQTRCKVLENLLSSPHRELSALEQRALLVHFRKRHPDLHPKSADFRRTIREDPYFNALQVKYGYAMTCHKAQGGEWDTVIVDFEANVGARNALFFRWSYTAITRAAKKLIIVNLPDFTPVSGMEWQGASGAPATTEQSDIQDLRTDPDWLRFSFSTAMAPLMSIHQKLRNVWGAQGITVEQLQHLQYCERYTVSRNNQRASVQYHYNGKFQVGKSSAVPGVAYDSSLANDALASINALANKPGTELANQFIQDFLNKLDAALESSDVQRTGYRAMSYRLRVSFADATRKGEIDFTYDGSANWTSAKEVGESGSTHGLFDEVRRLMASHRKEEQ